MTASDFTKLEHGPYGTRWSYDFEEGEGWPTVEEAERILGVKLAPRIHDATGERTDGRCEVVYFSAEEYEPNTVATYQVQ